MFFKLIIQLPRKPAETTKTSSYDNQSKRQHSREVRGEQAANSFPKPNLNKSKNIKTLINSINWSKA